jgi:hypothetical protein
MVGVDQPDDHREVYLCHVVCEFGATRAEEAFRDIDDYLRSHPNEVVMLILEDHVTPEDAIYALDRAGLDENAYSWEPGKPLPTLREMIESGNNLLVLVENEGGSPAWYHPAYEVLLQDTPYRFGPTDVFSCEVERGRPDAPLLLVNHWRTNDPPSARVAAEVNSLQTLRDRGRDCEAARGLEPNIIAVDFFSQGDVSAYVDELNGVSD